MGRGRRRWPESSRGNRLSRSLAASATRRRAGAAACALALAALSLAAWMEPACGQSLDTAVKATYLYKFAPFAEWPAAAFAGPAAAFVICIQGADPFGALLDRAVAGQRLNGRPIVVQRLSRLDAASACQIAYIAGSPSQSRAAALQAVGGAPVLTVTDEADGAAPRGILHFVLKDGRVRFLVDLRQADAAGVTISSKLLALAVTVSR